MVRPDYIGGADRAHRVVPVPGREMHADARCCKLLEKEMRDKMKDEMTDEVVREMEYEMRLPNEIR